MVMDASRPPQRGGRISLLVDPERTTLVAFTDSAAPDISAFPDMAVRSACASSFSRLARRSLALRPAHPRCHQFCDTLPEGFSHFVSSIAAPVASGWSGLPGGTCTHWKAPSCHG